MSIVHSNSYPCQAGRRDKKIIDQQLKQAVVNGTGLSLWESEVFVKVVDEMFFKADTGTLKPGDTLFCCVALKEGAGKPLNECEMVTARLTLFGAARGDPCGARQETRRGPGQTRSGKGETKSAGRERNVLLHWPRLREDRALRGRNPSARTSRGLRPFPPEERSR